MPIKTQGDTSGKGDPRRDEKYICNRTKKRAMHQDIRPIQILILNLMPLKEKQSCSFCVLFPIHRCRWM